MRVLQSSKLSVLRVTAEYPFKNIMAFAHNVSRTTGICIGGTFSYILMKMLVLNKGDVLTATQIQTNCAFSWLCQSCARFF